MKIVFYCTTCPSKFVTMHRFCAEILSRRKNPSVNAQAKEKKQRGKPKVKIVEVSTVMTFTQTFSTFRAHHQFFFFLIKASQCTQVDRKQMEHRYLIYSENFIVFLIYILVLSEQVQRINQYNLVPRVLSYPSGRLGERTWERGCKPTLLLSTRLHAISLGEKWPIFFLFVCLFFYPSIRSTFS